ncbi:recombinase family protein [Scrofimicrobium sp. R131]|uniref:Recombinase family protein n=1 Tax=Scrofimicrobium appendicitidis TaxID=3079930 RepID=A0AAU7V4W0_9ACTO
MTVAAVYLRVSKSVDTDDESLSLETQRKRIQWVCTARYGSTEWTRMLSHVGSCNFDVLVARDLDRLLRTLKNFVKLIDLGAKFAMADGEIDLTSVDGKFRATMVAAVARFEIRRKSEREEVLDELERVSRVKASSAADAAQNVAERADLDDARIDDAETLSWHRSDDDADILAARVAADEEHAERDYTSSRRERLASVYIAAAAAFEESLHETGYRELDKIEDDVKRQRLTIEFEGALATVGPLPPVENRYAAAARRDHVRKEAERSAIVAGGPQQTGPRTGDRGLSG